MQGFEAVSDFIQHLPGEHIDASSLGKLAQWVGQQAVGLAVINAPNYSVAVECIEILRHEMRGYQRRISPVQKPRLQPVMLRKRQPVPNRTAQLRLHMRVLAEVPE